MLDKAFFLASLKKSTRYVFSMFVCRRRISHAAATASSIRASANVPLPTNIPKNRVTSQRGRPTRPAISPVPSKFDLNWLRQVTTPAPSNTAASQKRSLNAREKEMAKKQLSIVRDQFFKTESPATHRPSIRSSSHNKPKKQVKTELVDFTSAESIDWSIYSAMVTVPSHGQSVSPEQPMPIDLWGDTTRARSHVPLLARSILESNASLNYDAKIALADTIGSILARNPLAKT